MHTHVTSSQAEHSEIANEHATADTSCGSHDVPTHATEATDSTHFHTCTI
jgi:hypothetical protein